MEYWLLGLLTFIFGYLTCATFYFLRSARLSVVLMRSSHVIYLSSLMKAIEALVYAREIMREHMLRSEKTSAEISTFEYRFEQDVSHLRTRSVEMLHLLHPEPFRRMIEFEDWSGAMEYLSQHRAATLKFWEKEDDR